MISRWTLAAVYRAACLSMTVLCDGRIIATRQHRCDGEPRTVAAFGTELAKLANAYGVETIIVEPDTPVATGARRTGRATCTMTLSEVRIALGIVGTTAALCQELISRYPELRRHIRRLPNDRIAKSDVRGQSLLLSVALGLAFSNKNSRK